MSDQHTGSQSDKPLFHGMDEKERVYAPEEVPGAVRPEADENPDAADQSGLTRGAVLPAPAGNLSGTGSVAGPQGILPVVPAANTGDNTTDDAAARADEDV